MNCDDAKPLLKLRRQIAVSDDLSLNTISSLIGRIDGLRWEHESVSPDCLCWVKARAEADKVPA